jgi:hypothetical protein
MLFDLVLSLFEDDKMEGEGIPTNDIHIRTALSIVEFVCGEKKLISYKNTNQQHVAI